MKLKLTSPQKPIWYIFLSIIHIQIHKPKKILNPLTVWISERLSNTSFLFSDPIYGCVMGCAAGWEIFSTLTLKTELRQCRKGKASHIHNAFPEMEASRGARARLDWRLFLYCVCLCATRIRFSHLNPVCNNSTYSHRSMLWAAHFTLRTWWYYISVFQLILYDFTPYVLTPLRIVLCAASPTQFDSKQKNTALWIKSNCDQTHFFLLCLCRWIRCVHYRVVRERHACPEHWRHGRGSDGQRFLGHHADAVLFVVGRWCSGPGNPLDSNICFLCKSNKAQFCLDTQFTQKKNTETHAIPTRLTHGVTNEFLVTLLHTLGKVPGPKIESINVSSVYRKSRAPIEGEMRLLRGVWFDLVGVDSANRPDFYRYVQEFDSASSVASRFYLMGPTMWELQSFGVNSVKCVFFLAVLCLMRRKYVLRSYD